MKFADFLENTGIPESLVRATVRQVGGWKAFREIADDVANNGADAGWTGFTYYSDTCAFFRRHKAAILELLKADAADTLGSGNVIEFCEQFRCLADVGADGIAETLYGRWADKEWQVTTANGLAWYVLECVCRSFVDQN